MPAPITNEPYSEQVTRAFNAFKFAPPQQLAAIAPQIQQNPQSPEATGFAMASNFQNQQRSAGAQMPQQTVYQKQIQQLLSGMQPPAPMDAGIAGVGANQYAMQDAAMQDPMRNAGIGAAPENTEGYGAATGGLVALAQGGPVRGFKIGGTSEVVIPELGTEYSPYEMEEQEASDEAVDQELENETGALNTHLAGRQATPKQSEPRQDGPDVHTPAPGSSAEKNSNKRAIDALKRSADDVMEMYGQSYTLSPEIMSQYQGEIKEANRDKWINALTQGIGGMLQAQTPNIGQAIGQGLLTGAAGYQQGAKEEAEARKHLLALRLASEKEQHADRRSAVQSVMSQASEARKLKEARDLMREKEGIITQRVLAATGQRMMGQGAVDANELQQRINDLFGKLQTNQRNRLDATLTGLSDAELYQRAVDMTLNTMQRAQTNLQSINPTPNNPVRFDLDENGRLRQSYSLNR